MKHTQLNSDSGQELHLLHDLLRQHTKVLEASAITLWEHILLQQ